MIDRVRRRLDVVVLILLAYLPIIAAAPGRGVADTKLYLFLDPARLMADARYTWDPQQFGGWVPHQTALYLWPSGPWFWLSEVIGLPDWVAHRLWVGTILLMAGLGIRLAARIVGLGPLGGFVAALVYQLSPYVLPYISRTSVMLLPWAGLGWIVAYTIRAATRERWRDAAIVALVVLTVGATNATATLMIAPAPLLWLFWSAARRDLEWRRALSTTARIGGLSLAVSLWWIVKVAVQGRYGAPVLAYSETLEAVSATSTAPEITRGLGYWLFYVSDPYVATTTAAAPHLQSPIVMFANFALVVIGLLGLAITKWTTRGYAALVIVAGVLLGVGAHTVDDPSFLQRLIFSDTRSGLALALRSSSRAVPLVTFGLALGLGALVDALRATSPDATDGRRATPTRGQSRLATATAGLVIALAVIGLPALRTGGYVDPALERDDEVPSWWTDAASFLDQSPSGGRVLQLPGQESAAFRWGYTVDPPLPGLSVRPLMARDWLPAGSAGVMDLLYALDDRAQSGILEAAAIAPVARWLGADVVWVPGDLAADRFDTARPEPVNALLQLAPGIDPPTTFGEAAVNRPSVPMIDEQSLGDPAVGSPIAQASLFPVQNPAIGARTASTVVIVAGNGDGLVDAAAAGVLDGRELVRYAADISDADLPTALDGSRLVITDTFRDRAHQWRGSQDVVGFTEDGSGMGVLVEDPADERLAVFPRHTSADSTIAVQRGPVTAAVSRYGEALRYRPENRAYMAIDGDPSTAWIVGDRGEPRGEFIDVHVDRPIDQLRLVQPLDPGTNRWITAIDLVLDPTADDAIDVPVQLDQTSRREKGQVIPLPRSTTHVRLVVRALDGRDRPELTGFDGVGFAEIDAGLGPSEEVVIPPRLEVPPNADVSVVLTRERISASDRWRSDPETHLVRELSAGLGPLLIDDVSVRLDRRADDATIAALLGVQVPTASTRLLGHPEAGGWAAFDGDVTTAWTTGFAEAVGAQLTVPDPSPSSRLVIVQPIDDEHSLVTAIRVERGDEAVDLPLPLPDTNRRSTVSLPRRIREAAGDIIVTVTGVDSRSTIDRRTFDAVQLPASIAEIEGLTNRVSLPERISTACRTDLLEVDGKPIGLEVASPVVDAFRGDAFTTIVCDDDPSITTGDRILRSEDARDLSVDRVVLRSPDETTDRDAGTLARAAALISSDRTHRRYEVSGCSNGCWFNMNEGRNSGWVATVEKQRLDDPIMLDGGMGGWWIPPGAETRIVDLAWQGQRSVDLALLISALSSAIIIAGILLNRRRAAVQVVDAGGPTLMSLHALRQHRVDGRRALVATTLATVVTAAAVSLSAGAVVAFAAGIGLVMLRRDILLTATTVAIISLTSLMVIIRQVIHRYPPDFGWISHMDDLHRPYLVALILLVTAIMAASTRDEDR